MTELAAATGDKHIVPISYLSNWDKNPRTIVPKDFERLKKQITELGQYKPLLVTKEGIIIGGNMRYKAYLELGHDTAWVSLIEFKQEEAGDWYAYIDGRKQAKPYANKEQAMVEYALSDNDRAGHYDEDMLAALTPQFNIDWATYAVDMKPPTDVAKFMERHEKQDEDDPPELNESEEAISKPGEVYQLGRHRLLCGDATDPASYQKLMGDKTASLVLTDPPYNVDYTGKTAEALKIQNDKWTGDGFYAFLVAALQNAMAACNGVFYICMSSGELHRLRPAFEEAGGKFSCFIIWAKNNFTLGRGDWQQQYEPILYGWNAKNKAHYYTGYRDEGNVWRNLEALKPKRLPSGDTELTIGNYTFIFEGEVHGKVQTKHTEVDLWDIKRPAASREHPTMKPIKLCTKAIKASSRPEEIVLDPFLGSGSTLVACEKTNRVCYGMELDPHYCDVIRIRYANLLGLTDWQEATKAAA